MAQSADTCKRDILRALWRDKVHVAPRALELSAPSVRDAFEHILAPADSVIDLIRPLPVGLLETWHENEQGHIVVHHNASRYEAGPYAWRTGDLHGVALVCVADLVNDTSSARGAILALLDHLLGSDCLGDRLSEGVGINEALADMAQRFMRIEALSYGHDRLSVATPSGYLLSTWALYLEDPRLLNVIDPLMFRLFRDRMMNPRFWA